MHTDSDIRPLHRQAVTATVDVIATVTARDLGRPTPCAGWDLADLITHMTVQHRGFAASARGDGKSLSIWDPATVTDAVRADPGGAYAAAAADVLDAFSAPGVLEATFTMPEFGPGATVPGTLAIGFHFVDYVVHGWDVARSLERPFAPAGDVLAAVLPLALGVPDGEIRDAPNSPFAHALVQRDGAGELDRLLRHLGRSPDWRPVSR
ncbi:TIGR03086 family protein [Mycolicibacterium flavescens]|uniref:TIGR03086 family protein n=1 Tax=Mycolicibacterium flavescens TaxID=1776 RepID=A0A1E3RNX0_MYCFV|nr:TIGR03086 family metal-binding protein [Mycolicibacterium flavescens]MCV7281539.1 TIGR03086 family protein [Mycolicibacterium flavescens]ODQ91585.1 TIGR03086 family protein [Mycolicibacterium flavescens]